MWALTHDAQRLTEESPAAAPPFLRSEAGYVLIVTFGDDRQACREWLFSSLTVL
jgi:hypothetical protein